MKSVVCSALFLLTFSQNAQAPTAVAVKDEPHHHLVLENSYVRVFRVSIPANDATLLHQHDLPYAFVALGPADFTNAVAGKPEVEAKLADGQLGYSRGGFAHIARTDHGIPFNNVTIELLHPQGEPRNLCLKVVDAPLGSCRAHSTSSSALVIKTIPAIETEEVQVDLVQVESRNFSLGLTRKLSRLLVALNGAYLQVEVSGQPARMIGPGESVWLPGDGISRISAAPNFLLGSSYMMVNFKDTYAGPKR
jgi:hypothetical protein